MQLLINKFLGLNGYASHIGEFNENFLSHPNYPSLYSITDTLTLMGVVNLAAIVPKDKVAELPTVFLAFIESEEKKLALGLVEKDNGKIFVWLENSRKREYLEAEFEKSWSGLVIAVESTAFSIPAKIRPTTLLKRLLIALGLAVLYFSNAGQDITLLSALSFMTYLSGLAIAVLIVQEKLEKNQEGVSKFCSYGKKLSCESVIRSKGAKINRWLDFSDLPILFYAAAIIAMLINPKAFHLLNSLTALAVPLIMYSVWIQKVVLKKWCMLCLCISLILLFQCMLFLISPKFDNLPYFSFLAGAFLAATIWFLAKSQLEDNKVLETSNRSLKRFKRNYRIFTFLKTPLAVSSHGQAFSRIQAGRKFATLEIILVLSPSCGHCHTAFEQGLLLYRNDPENVTLSILYNLNPQNKDNPYLEVAANTMQINRHSSERALEALCDWHIRKFSLKDWLAKWGQTEIESETYAALQLQYSWCLQNNLNYTPVKILNDALVPKEYDLAELRFFQSEIKENREAAATAV